MENVKTTIDREYERYKSESIIHLSADSYESHSKKRKFSVENVSGLDITLTDDSLNRSQTMVPTSPWEIRRLKADLIDNDTKIIHLKKELENRATAHSNMESLYTVKVKGLENQLEKKSEKIADLEKHLKFVRKREATLNAEMAKLRSQSLLDKQNHSESVSELQRANKALENKCRRIEHELGGAVTNIQRQYKDLEKNHASAVEKCEELQESTTVMQEKIQQFAETNKQYGIQKQQLEAAQRKIAALEEEILTFSEWKKLYKGLESDSSRLSDMEKKYNRLQSENKELHKCIGDKLLLEEEVEHLKTRLANNEKLSEEVVNSNAKIPYIEQELAAFKAVANDHCSEAATPSHLRSRIEEILRKDLLLVSENGSLRIERDSIAGQVDELKKQIATLTKSGNDLQVLLKNHRESFHKVQRKLRLVVSERDCYKQLIENYEKNVTISGSDTTVTDMQMRLRLEMLEKTVNGYKDMCANLEKELQSAKNSPDHVESFSNEQYKKVRKELEALKDDNERLRRRKDELELLFEHSNMKDAYNIPKYKVMHMAMNPADQAYENNKNEIEKLQAEVERLKRKNRKLEADNEEFTAANLTFDIKEVNNLRAQVKSLEGQKQHITDSYRTNINEFRDACYLLFGFKVDKQHGNIYRLSSMYAESPDEYLTFKMSDDSDISLMESVYSNSISDFIEKTLIGPNSIPVFLSSLTIDLFNRTTMIGGV
ncbi:mitotic spindle assembly checkpoint protein MAD1 isoform X2 [Bradysia coprophila]|uniref:mitotic spindle assembly checkpoint protein MAD1 isoform X2 n=1 Tax=Bradysia coprophila TaxID=38358 RepID=UPI00187DB129|nr:mitotic spindle assembly checkpoint protein MAD1 isoform X2 [Bradysia coprophila]